MKRPRSGTGKLLPTVTLNRRERETSDTPFPALLRQDAGGRRNGEFESGADPAGL